jgi:hypothetical protein
MWVPEMDFTEKMLEQLIAGEAVAYHRDDSAKGTRYAYHLADWQKPLFERAKETGILMNPTRSRFADDALQNVWVAYEGIHQRAAVLIRIEPHLTWQAGALLSPDVVLGLDIRPWAEYSVVYHVPIPRKLHRRGMDELRLLMTIVTDDDPMAPWKPGASHVDTNWGELIGVPPSQALAIAAQVLAIMRQCTEPLQSRHERG